jgi:hypothetical protein
MGAKLANYFLSSIFSVSLKDLTTVRKKITIQNHQSSRDTQRHGLAKHLQAPKELIIAN